MFLNDRFEVNPFVLFKILSIIQDSNIFNIFILLDITISLTLPFKKIRLGRGRGEPKVKAIID